MGFIVSSGDLQTVGIGHTSTQVPTRKLGLLQRLGNLSAPVKVEGTFPAPTDNCNGIETRQSKITDALFQN